MMIHGFKRLESKRNHVYLIQSGTESFIVKVHKTSEKSYLESENVKLLRDKGVRVPRILGVSENILIEEFIEGKTIGDLISRADTTWTESLGKWFSEIHSIKKQSKTLLKGDCNLKNFIFTEKEIFGVDFEYIHYGNPYDDLGKLCFFIMDSNSQMSMNDKKHLIKRFLSAYEDHSKTVVNPKIVAEYMEIEKKRALIRRERHTPKWL